MELVSAPSQPRLRTTNRKTYSIRTGTDHSLAVNRPEGVLVAFPNLVEEMTNEATH
jgi:hypothetical protein